MNPDYQPVEMPEIRFEELEAPPQLDQALLNKVDTFLDSNNWTESFHCVTMVRQINKFFPQYIPDVMNRYSNQILKLLEKGKTQIIKNIMRLLKEVFDMGKDVCVEKAVYYFLPVLLKKAATDIGHIKEMSQLLLTSFSDNCGYDISFVISANLCCEKNTHIAEISIKLLTRLVQNIGPNVIKLKPETLKVLTEQMSNLIRGTRQNMKTHALDICMFVYNQIGKDNYIQLMNFSLTPEDIEIMARCMQGHRLEKPKRVPLSVALKNHRRTTMHSMMKEQDPNLGNVCYNNHPKYSNFGENAYQGYQY